MSDDFVLARLLGHTTGKRVLELGCGDGRRAVELARGGATVITVDPSAEAVLATRQRAQDAEARIEGHTGDLADLAFLRGDSVDVAFAEGSLATLADLGRVFRQVQRVLRAGAWFAFSLPHPLAECVQTDPEPAGALPLERAVPRPLLLRRRHEHGRAHPPRRRHLRRAGPGRLPGRHDPRAGATGRVARSRPRPDDGDLPGPQGRELEAYAGRPRRAGARRRRPRRWGPRRAGTRGGSPAPRPRPDPARRRGTP